MRGGNREYILFPPLYVGSYYIFEIFIPPFLSSVHTLGIIGSFVYNSITDTLAPTQLGHDMKYPRNQQTTVPVC